MKNYVFHLIAKRGSIVANASASALALVESKAENAPKNDLLLIYKLPSIDPRAAIAVVLDAKARGWNPPIDPLSFFLNRTEDVFLLDWNDRRLLTRSTFEALRSLGKIDLAPDAAPHFSAERLDRSRSETSREPFEFLAFGSLDAFCSAVERRYLGAQTLTVETSPSI